MGKKAQTIGYRYYMSLLSGLCRGPIDELRAIKIGGEIAWEGGASDATTQHIDSPNLFGGDKKEGGVQGPFKIFMGDQDQVLPDAQDGLPSVKASIATGRVSEFRRTVNVWFDGLVSAMNPYLKEWKFRVRRTTAGWYNNNVWYPAKATVYLSNDVLAVETKGGAISSSLEETAATISWSGPGNAGDQVTINGNVIDIVGSSDEVGEFKVKVGNTATQTAQRVKSVIVAHAPLWSVSVEGDNAVLSIKLSSADNAIFAMNPAHIVYESCTNPEWGRGLPVNMMDENAAVYAANLFCAEGFGLCIGWYRKEDIDAFVQKVCDLAGMVLYTDRETGLTVMRAIRSDYTIDDLPLFTPNSGLLEIVEDDSASSDSSYNEVIGNGRDPVSNLDFQVRAQNLAAFQAQQSVVSLDQDYKGIPTKSLLSRVVLRDLRANATGLKKYQIKLDRRGWRIAPGMPFRISDPARGLTNVILRAGEIDDGNMLSGEITIKAIMDVFGLPKTSYTTPVRPSWNPPSKIAVPPIDERLIEMGYRDLYLEAGEGNATSALATAGYVGQLAVAPSPISYQYDLATKAEGAEYVVQTTGSFTGNAKLAAAISASQTLVTFKTMQSFDAANVGQGLLIGDEIVRLDALNEDTGVATIVRGCADTVPQTHPLNALAWTIDDDLTFDGQTYDRGEVVKGKVLTRTSSDLLGLADATEEAVTITSRQARPYPPAKVTVGGVSIFEPRSVAPEPVIAWVPRNRLLQADHLIGHGEDGVQAEVGTSYTIRVYKQSDLSLLRTVAGITDLTWTYTAAMQAADVAGNSVIVEIESARDGLTSWQHYRFVIALKAGWGYSWGIGWGSPA